MENYCAYALSWSGQGSGFVILTSRNAALGTRMKHFDEYNMPGYLTLLVETRFLKIKSNNKKILKIPGESFRLSITGTLKTQASFWPPNSASVYTQGRLWRHDFYDGAKLRRADLKSGVSHIRQVLCLTLLQCELLFGPSRR